VNRCDWTNKGSPQELIYHDVEWGVPSFKDRHLFEMLILEGAQAGLSWSTILKKREGYRRAYDDFDPEKMALYTPTKKLLLLQDAGIVRNRLKIDAAVTNAQAYLDLLGSGTTLSAFVWDFVEGTPRQNRWKNQEEVPASSVESAALSKALKQRGFKFVGSTICYAFMQAVGMVNDHTLECFRYAKLAKTNRP
jgi:DNA-3-methyladenine glycosylase I